MDAREIAEVGIVEVVKHIPSIYRRFREVVREARDRRPDAAVLIDFPDFNLRLAREFHKHGVPVIYYVSPQLWAWKQWRIERVRKYVRQMLVIFPFEEQFYREHGIEAKFVGHPLAELPAPAVTRRKFAAEYDGRSRRMDCAVAGQPPRRGVAYLPGFAGSSATSGAGLRLHSAGRFDAGSELDGVFHARSFRPTDHFYARCARNPAARPRRRRRQRHLDAASGVDRDALHDGVPSCAAHLESGPPSSKSGPLCHGESDCRTRRGSGAGAGRLHAAACLAELRRIIPDGEARKTMIHDFQEVRQRLAASDSGGSASDRAASAVLSIAGKCQ